MKKFYLLILSFGFISICLSSIVLTIDRFSNSLSKGHLNFFGSQVYFITQRVIAPVELDSKSKFSGKHIISIERTGFTAEKQVIL
jgi:hypothetical protein